MCKPNIGFIPPWSGFHGWPYDVIEGQRTERAEQEREEKRIKDALEHEE